MIIKRENKKKEVVKREKEAEKMLWRQCSGRSWERLIADEVAVAGGDRKRSTEDGIGDGLSYRVDYLAGLLHKEQIAEVDVGFFSNPQRIVLLLAAQLSTSQAVSLEEVYYHGRQK